MKKKIKTIHNKMAKILHLNVKNKLSKQAEQKQNHRYGDYLEGYLLEWGRGRLRGKVQELRSTYW